MTGGSTPASPSSRAAPDSAYIAADHRGKGVGFNHEVYTLRAAEAIYESGTQPVGPATFCRLEAVRSGEGRSRQRLDQFRGTGE